MQLPPGLLHLISQTRLFSDKRSYVILRLPLGQWQKAAHLLARINDPFATIVFDKDEVTLVLSRESWETWGSALQVLDESPDYRLITFDLPLDLELVGYFATLTGVIAEVGCSIFAISAFSRDHVFVPAEDFGRAWGALDTLIRSCQNQKAEV